MNGLMEMLTTNQVAQKWGVTAERVRQLVRAGRLPFTPTPYGALFDPAEVTAADAARRMASTAR